MLKTQASRGPGSKNKTERHASKIKLKQKNRYSQPRGEVLSPAFQCLEEASWQKIKTERAMPQKKKRESHAWWRGPLARFSVLKRLVGGKAHFCRHAAPLTGVVRP